MTLFLSKFSILSTGVRTSTYELGWGYSSTHDRPHVWIVVSVSLVKLEDVKYADGLRMLTDVHWQWNPSCVDVHPLEGLCPILLEELGMKRSPRSSA